MDKVSRNDCGPNTLGPTPKPEGRGPPGGWGGIPEWRRGWECGSAAPIGLYDQFREGAVGRVILMNVVQENTRNRRPVNGDFFTVKRFRYLIPINVCTSSTST